MHNVTDRLQSMMRALTDFSSFTTTIGALLCAPRIECQFTCSKRPGFWFCYALLHFQPQFQVSKGSEKTWCTRSEKQWNSENRILGMVTVPIWLAFYCT